MKQSLKDQRCCKQATGHPACLSLAPHYRFLVLVLLFSCCHAADLVAQPRKLWDRAFGGRDEDYLSVVLQTSDGGYLLSGTSASGANGNKTDVGRGKLDYWIIKVSADGSKQWDKAYGGSEDDILTSVSQTTDGGYILGGYSESGDGDKNSGSTGYYDDWGVYEVEPDFWIVKVSANGTLQWEQNYASERSDELRSLTQTTDGGYILAGTYRMVPRWGEVNTYDDFSVIKLDATGGIQWNKKYGNTGTEQLATIRQTLDGGYILGGSTTSDAGMDVTQGTKGESDYWIVKIAPDGTQQWDKTFGGSGNDLLSSLQQTRDGGYMLGGSSTSGANGDKSPGLPISSRDYWIVKLSANGIKQWDRTYGVNSFAPASQAREGESFLTSVQQTRDGNYLVGGYTASIGDFNNFWVLKLSQQGNRIWDLDLDGFDTDELMDLKQTADGGYILAGSSEDEYGGDGYRNGGFGERDYWIVKLGPDITTRSLEFSKQTLAFAASAGQDIPAQINVLSTLAPDNNSLDLKITRTANAPWLVLPKAVAGNMYFHVNATGLAPGSYTAHVTVSAAGYASTVLPVTLQVYAEPKRYLGINAGGSALEAFAGRPFQADGYFSGIDRTSVGAAGNILNTAEDELYRSARCAAAFNYKIPVANGQMDVVLHFAETWFGAPGGSAGGAGKRRFHVDLEGSRKLTNYDIFARAGGAMRAVQAIIPVTVNDGILNIDFLSGAADLPRISGIEVIPKSVTLVSTADNYKQYANYINSFFGELPYLNVKSTPANPELNRRAFIKFNLDPVVPVSSAKLRVYGRNYENNKQITVWVWGATNGDWTEGSLLYNYNNLGSRTDVLGSFQVNHISQYYELDVTSFVKAQQKEGRDQVTFMLADLHERNTRLVFNSRQNPSNPPQLIVQSAPFQNSAARVSLENGASERIPEEAASIVSPNPVKKQFTVQISSKHSEAISLEVLNNAGQSYPIVTAQKAVAGQKAEVDISGLALSTGIYLLKIKSEAATEVIKLLVID